MSKRSPGSKYAMKQGRARYLEERARFRAKRDRRLEADTQNQQTDNAEEATK